ncbi:hypothetical protein P7C70_g2910, partial [Phenoliferia sp. Uapishka_3]
MGDDDDYPTRPHSLDLPADLARPSSLSLRPHLNVQTRIRSRSLISGGGSSAPVPFLSPTLAGSPVLPNFSTFLSDANRSSSNVGSSSLARNGGGHPREESGGEDDDEGVPGIEEGGSTESESPPQTPADGMMAEPLPPFRLPGTVDTEPWGPYAKDKRKNEVRLDGATRIRRGRSFTSLMMPTAQRSPQAVERQDPMAEIAEVTTPPPLSDLESGELDRRYEKGTSTFPPLPAVVLSIPPPKTLRNFVPQVALLAVLFTASFGMIWALVASLPNLFIPHSVSDLPALTNALSVYRASSVFAELHLFVVLSFLFLWKQCFSIPGSVLTNILFGALYGTWAGTTWACLWTAGGSTGAYYIARIISPLVSRLYFQLFKFSADPRSLFQVEHYFSTPLGITRRALNLPDPAAPSTSSAPTATQSDLFSHLLLARFFPLLPYSVLNVISGVLGLPVPLFFITLVIGSFPFNFATVSVGEVVALAAADPSTSLGTKIWSPAIIRKLVLVTIISVLPVIFKKQLQKWASSPELKSALAGLPTQGKFLWGRLSGAVARKVFRYEGTQPGANAIPAFPSSHGQGQRGSGGRSGVWRHKFNPSWGGDGFRMERTSNDYDSGSSGGLLA